MGDSRRERRERRRWEKEMLRRLEELDELDRRHGLGTSPSHVPQGRRGWRQSRHRGLPRVERHRRRSTSPVLPGLLVVLCLLLFVFFKSPTTTGERLRQFVDGLDGGDESYAFTASDPTGLPVSWDACEPIPFTVNPDGAPGDWEEIVGDAVSQVEDASGFDLKDEGTSDERYADRRGGYEGSRGGPVLISWASPDEVDALRGDTAGIGGSTAVTRNGETRFVTGIVVLDDREFEQMSTMGRDRAATLILAHELAHVIGLDHVDDRHQLMNPSYVGQDGFGDGDRAGFEVLHDMPCG